MGTPKFGWNRGGVADLAKKPAISLKRGTIGPMLYYDDKWEVAYVLSIGTKINDLDFERLLRTVFQNK